MNRSSLIKKTVSLEPVDNRRLAALCGQQDEYLHQVADHFNVLISHRGQHFQIEGAPLFVKAAEGTIHQLYSETQGDKQLTPANIHLHLSSQRVNAPSEADMKFDNQSEIKTTMKSKIKSNKKANLKQNIKQVSPYSLQESDQMRSENRIDSLEAADAENPDQKKSHRKKEITFKTKAGIIKAYTDNQRTYLENIFKYDINFCIGPAGTGKTYLAVAAAVDALQKGTVQRILLVRPAVEAGEKLGFLPGDLAQKIEPYLRPLYDALFEMLGFEHVAKLLEQTVIELAPLAFMRGRTLNDAFIILDESQNTTLEQMKMFLTRIGFGSKAIITGDVTQVDLPMGRKSGLVDAMDVLNGVKGISFSLFDSKDVVRHTLVQRIVEAYAKYEEKNKGGKL